MSTMVICIVIFVLTIILYATNKLEMGVVGLGGLALLVIFGCMEPNDALSYFANSNVLMMMSMFVVSTGLSRTSLIDRFSAGITKLTGNSFRRTFLCYIILAEILTSFLNSPLVAFSIVLPLVVQMCEDYNVSPSKVMFPIGLVCIACCCIMPFGAAIQQTGIYNGFLESYGFAADFAPTDFLVGRWPFLIIVPLWSFTMGYKIAPEKPVVPVSLVTVSRSEKKPLNKFSDWAGVIIFFGVVVLFIFGGNLGIPSWLVCFTGALLTVICGTLTTKEAIGALPINLAAMLVGALAMAGALSSTGAGEMIGQAISVAIGGVKNGYILGAVFFLIPFVLTQFMQNQAVMNIFVPICLLTCQAIGADPMGLIILITAGSLTAFMTPMATSSIPAIMGAGGYDIKSLVKQSWLASIIFAVVYVLYTMTVMPVF